MIPRSIYYNSKLLISQSFEKGKYAELGKTITSAILNFSLLKEEPSCYNKYRLKNVKTSRELSDLIEISYFELEKFVYQRKSIKEMSNRELWGLSYLRRA